MSPRPVVVTVPEIPACPCAMAWSIRPVATGFTCGTGLAYRLDLLMRF